MIIIPSLRPSILLPKTIHSHLVVLLASLKVLVGVLVVTGTLLFVGVRSADAAEGISEFSSDITINQDTSITIREQIQYHTDVSKHGIYRYVPLRYTLDGLNYTAHIRQVKVTDDKGASLPFEQRRQDGNLVLKIGDPDRTFVGKQTYVISYQVENAVREIDVDGDLQQPELFWDVTGEGWQLLIASSSAVIRSPYAPIRQAHCFSGRVGGNDGGCRVDFNENQARYIYDRPIVYGSNLSVAVELGPGLRLPTIAERWGKRLIDNRGLGALLIPGVIMASWWWLRGRDQTFVSWNVFADRSDQPVVRVSPFPWLRRPAPMVYEPLEDLTPGEAGALYDEMVHNQDIVAEIIELARKKYLEIKQHTRKKMLGLHQETEYQFVRLKPADDQLSAAQVYLHQALFQTHSNVTLSALKGDFYLEFEKIRSLLFATLVEKRLFTAHPRTVRAWGLGVALTMEIMSFFSVASFLEQGLWLALPIFAISTAVSLLAAFHLPAKTARGNNLALQARGLRQTIARGAWREKIKERHLFFEEMLPFAVAFGVVDRLSRDMEQLGVKPPQYLAHAQVHGWTTAHLMQSFTSNTTSSLTFNPSSSSMSSGSSSGGSSGGGGGGGGGGSW